MDNVRQCVCVLFNATDTRYVKLLFIQLFITLYQMIGYVIPRIVFCGLDIWLEFSEDWLLCLGKADSCIFVHTAGVCLGTNSLLQNLSFYFSYSDFAIGLICSTLFICLFFFYSSDIVIPYYSCPYLCFHFPFVIISAH
jgi:hypothetical protein